MIDSILTAGLTIAVFMIIVFIIAQTIKNNSIVDIGWGLGFIATALILLFEKGQFNNYNFVFISMILIWGLRLALHIFLRARGKGEDFRYAQWRKEWGKNAAAKAFFKVFVLQGIIMLIVALPIIIVFSSAKNQLNVFSLIGFLIFAFGFLFESIADFQLYCFKKNPENKGKIITSGLWKFTRHPNYFGEAVLWWGIAIFTIGAENYIISFISPVVINLLLVFVSGVPLLEKKYAGNIEWEEYKKVTPAFVPIFGKKG